MRFDFRQLDQFSLTVMPIVSLYGDGRVIAQALHPERQDSPRSALPDLRLTRLTDEGIQLVLQAARDAGLMEGSKHYRATGGIISVRDPGTKFFTVNVAGQRSVVSVDLPYGLPAENLDAEEVEARQKLNDFEEFMTSIPESLPDSVIADPEQPYEIERLQIVSGILEPFDPDAALRDIRATIEAERNGRSQPADATPEVDAPTPSPEPRSGPPPMSWPLDQPLATFGDPFNTTWSRLSEARCGVVDGAEAEALVAALTEANRLPLWESEGVTYNLYPRPLLPDEEGCLEA